MIIREFQIGDEKPLRHVFFSAVHGTAIKDYTVEQINAWAPEAVDWDAWNKRVRDIHPFVVEIDGDIVAYADVQESGYIDHFFVASEVGGQGVGSALMKHLLEVANSKKIHELTSNVSRTAQPFFATFGFLLIEHNEKNEIRGVVIPNAFMKKVLET